MGFSTDSRMVRVDFFKETGKWYSTDAVCFVGYNSPDIFDAVCASLALHLPGDRYDGMRAVILEPYHAHPFPIMIDVDKAKLEARSKGLIIRAEGGYWIPSAKLDGSNRG